MVGHQNIGMDGAAAIASRFFKPMEVALVVLLGKEAGLAIDAALNDVQRVIGEKNAWAAWHVRFSESQMTLTPLVDSLIRSGVGHNNLGCVCASENAVGESKTTVALIFEFFPSSGK
jgi:hypothetical protein